LGKLPILAFIFPLVNTHPHLPKFIGHSSNNATNSLNYRYKTQFLCYNTQLLPTTPVMHSPDRPNTRTCPVCRRNFTGNGNDQTDFEYLLIEFLQQPRERAYLNRQVNLADQNTNFDLVERALQAANPAVRYCPRCNFPLPSNSN
jgi:hypothetical protein